MSIASDHIAESRKLLDSSPVSHYSLLEETESSLKTEETTKIQRECCESSHTEEPGYTDGWTGALSSVKGSPA